MPRPRTQADYLARLTPPSVLALQASRRALLRRALGAGAVLGLGGTLLSCGGDDDDDASGAPGTTTGATTGAPTGATSGRPQRGLYSSRGSVFM
jgi:multiple sugar transport system substrate-binding protein